MEHRENINLGLFRRAAGDVEYPVAFVDHLAKRRPSTTSPRRCLGA